MTIITDKPTVEVPTDVLERLVEGYHQPKGFDHEDGYLDDSGQWDNSCRCGLRWTDIHLRQMLREAEQGVFLL